jgi:hypothetical protein
MEVCDPACWVCVVPDPCSYVIPIYSLRAGCDMMSVVSAGRCRGWYKYLHWWVGNRSDPRPPAISVPSTMIRANEIRSPSWGNAWYFSWCSKDRSKLDDGSSGGVDISSTSSSSPFTRTDMEHRDPVVNMLHASYLGSPRSRPAVGHRGSFSRKALGYYLKVG